MAIPSDNDPFAEFVAQPAQAQAAPANADPFAEFVQPSQAAPAQTAPVEKPKKLALPEKTDTPAKQKRKEIEQSKAIEGSRSVLRGGTLGLSDVIGAGVAAIPAAIGGDMSYGEAYKDIKDSISLERDQFREENPAIAYGGEIAGAVIPAILSGGTTAAAQGAGAIGKTAATVGSAVTKAGNAIKAAPVIGGLAAKTGAGATMGAIYGGSQAETDNALGGMALGAATGGAGQWGVNKVIEKLVPKAAISKAVSQITDDIKSPEFVNNLTIQLKNEGIDFNALTQEAKQAAIDFAAKAASVGDDAAKTATVAGRKAVLESLPEPIKATRGTLTKDYVQQQKEGLIADTSEILGRDLRSTLNEYQPGLVKNLDIIKGKTGGKADDLYQTGEALRGTVESRAAGSMQKIKEAYKAADELAGENAAQLGDNVTQWLNENAGFNGVSAVTQKAKALGILAEQKLDDGTTALVPQPTTFRKLYELRKAAGALQQSSDGTTKNIGGQFKNLVDDVFDEQGGQLYKDAAKLRRQHALQYESGPKVIRDILKKRAGSETDKAIANEDLFAASVVRGSADDVKKLYGYLLKDKKYRKEGIQQIKDLRSMAIENLKTQASQGQGGFTSSQWNKSLRQIGGREKLEAVFGKEGYKEIQNFTKAADILLNKEKSMAGGSQTASRLAMMGEALFSKLGKLPIVGGTVEGAGKVIQTGITSMGAKNALTDPLGDVAARASKQAARNALMTPAASAARRAAVVSSVGAEQ